MERSNKKMIIVAIILAILTSGLIFSYLKKIESTNKNIEFQNVVVAVRNIEPRTIITVQDIKEIKIEKSLVNINSIFDKTEVLGKTTKEPIYEGEQILSTRLANKDNASLTYQIPKGKRAITINVSEASAVGFFINPGDFVDVITTLENIQDSMNAISKTVIQNALILGVGQEKDTFNDIEQKSEKKDLKNTAESSTTKTVTLAVTQQEAEKIALSEQTGTIRLTLRPVGDVQTVETYGTAKSDLIK